MNDYWKQRVARDEKKASSIAASYAEREKKYYQQMLKKINLRIDYLFIQIQNYGVSSVTRTQLWQYKHYLQLRQTITEEAQKLYSFQLHIADSAIQDTFEIVIGKPINQINEELGLLTAEPKRIINSAWSGKSYSQRIYDNVNELAKRVENKVTDLIILGKTPQEVKKEIALEANISYRQADRLIRTEVSYVLNSSSIERYKDAGVSKVEILVESDCCKKCAIHDGVEYDINNAPLVPIHPNCRCSYIPVIE